MWHVNQKWYRIVWSDFIFWLNISYLLYMITHHLIKAEVNHKACVISTINTIHHYNFDALYLQLLKLKFYIRKMILDTDWIVCNQFVGCQSEYGENGNDILTQLCLLFSCARFYSGHWHLLCSLNISKFIKQIRQKYDSLY